MFEVFLFSFVTNNDVKYQAMSAQGGFTLKPSFITIKECFIIEEFDQVSVC